MLLDRDSIGTSKPHNNGILTLLEAPECSQMRLQTSSRQVFSGRPLTLDITVLCSASCPHLTSFCRQSRKCSSFGHVLYAASSATQGPSVRTGHDDARVRGVLAAAAGRPPVSAVLPTSCTQLPAMEGRRGSVYETRWWQKNGPAY